MSQKTRTLYVTFTIVLDNRLSILYPFIGDFITVVTTDADLSKVLGAIDEGDFVPLNTLVPAEISHGLHFLRLKWDSSQVGKEITFIVGGEYRYRLSQQYVVIGGDFIGLAREATLQKLYSDVAKQSTLQEINTKLSAPITLRTARVLLDNSTATTANVFPLFGSSTPSKYATIYYPVKLVLDDFTAVDQSAAPAILIGDSTIQAKTMYPGDKIETAVSDLSVIYVKLPAGAKIYLEVVWEV